MALIIRSTRDAPMPAPVAAPVAAPEGGVTQSGGNNLEAPVADVTAAIPFFYDSIPSVPFTVLVVLSLKNTS